MTGERILIVDDSTDIREFVIGYVLKPNSYDYIEARDGLEGFDLIVSDPPELILLDLQMPRLDGIGLLKKMREENINIPVVLMTFYGSEEIAIEVFRLGVRDYVQKPFTDDDMLAAIENALREARLRNERDALKELLLAANQDLQRRVRDLEALYKFGKVIVGQSSVDTLVIRAVESAARVVAAKKAELWLLDEDGKSLISRATKQGDSVNLARRTIESDLAQQAIKSGQPAIGEPQLDDTSEQFTVQVCTPVIIGEKPLGMLVITTLADQVSEHQLDLLGALADYTAAGLDRARLVKMVKED